MNLWKNGERKNMREVEEGKIYKKKCEKRAGEVEAVEELLLPVCVVH